jgi:nicotinate-nucleotide pyrophosphorylase (carboxylating)
MFLVPIRPVCRTSGTVRGACFSLHAGSGFGDDRLVITLSNQEIRGAVRQALAEDIGQGDATTLATVSANAVARAEIVARESLVLAGLAFAGTAFQTLSRRVRLESLAADGDCIRGGQAVLRLEGPARALLTGERVALNFLQRLSGVATLTAQYVRAVAGTQTRILDTRKTTPGWRRFEKYAVTCGGGMNHRRGLDDLVLIKDNHLAALAAEKPNAIVAAVQRARARYPKLKVEVEADTLRQVRQAVAAGADFVLLDNMRPARLRRAVALVDGRALTEASGGITLDTVRAAAESGVDFISVGALTHSARAVDLGLDFTG